MQHRRSIDLLNIAETPSLDIGDGREAVRDWSKLTDAELLRLGEHLRREVDGGRRMWRRDLEAARAEWRRRQATKRTGSSSA